VADVCEDGPLGTRGGVKRARGWIMRMAWRRDWWQGRTRVIGL
jgi:hypothetical protein